MTAGDNTWRQHLATVVTPLLFVLLLSPASLLAQPIHPLAITNTSPVILVQGVPNARDPRITAPGDFTMSLVYEVTSHFTTHSSSNEQLMFDGETTRALLSLKTGVGRDMELEIQLPYIAHAGGFLDSTIIHWHDLFSLPQNGRDQAPQNQLEYFYQKNGVVVLDFQEPAGGMGDAQVIVGVQLNKRWLPNQNHLSLKAAIKFPTGDAAQLTGSGAYGVSAWLTGDMQTDWFGQPGVTHMSLGGMWLEQGDVLPGQQRSWAWFGGAGSGIQVSERVVLQAQLDWHSQLYKDSGFVEIDSYALQLTLGGNLKFNDAWNLDIGVVEDLIVHASPDVICHFSLNSRF
ncbi:MAG TPA: DUF3187 family protein [Gammaproteobacteria bacterium]